MIFVFEKFKDKLGRCVLYTGRVCDYSCEGHKQSLILDPKEGYLIQYEKDCCEELGKGCSSLRKGRWGRRCPS